MENKMVNQDRVLADSPIISVVPTLLENITFNIGTLLEARKRFAAQLAPDFNLFNFLRHNEMGLSSAIADLLDPNGTHGQGNVFLERFVRNLATDYDCADYDWIASTNDWQVSTEKTLSNQRRLDIYMQSKNGLVAIENKPWAGDQEEQLIAYAEYLREHAQSIPWLLIYLGNSEPSEGSINKSERQRLEQSKNLRLIKFDFLVEWLDECATKARALPVRVFIEELAKYIRTRVNGEMDMSEKNEVVKEILKSQKNIEAAFHVVNAIDSLKENLLDKFHDELKDACMPKGYKLEWDRGMKSGKKGAGFGVKLEGSHRLYIRIEFFYTSWNYAEWGIRREDKDVERDDVVWKNIHDLMTKNFGVGKISDRWPWWSTVEPIIKFGKEIDQWNRADWNRSEIPWIKMDNGELVELIVDLADKVKKALSDANSLHLLK
jgi:hypothetical protein